MIPTKEKEPEAQSREASRAKRGTSAQNDGNRSADDASAGARGDDRYQCGQHEGNRIADDASAGARGKPRAIASLMMQVREREGNRGQSHR